MDEQTWRPTIGALMNAFRKALLALLPALREARIPLGVHPGVDAWDEITEVLFKHIVGEAVRWSFAEDRIDTFSFPRYETDYVSYDQFDALIVVRAPELSALEAWEFAFHSFASREGEAELNQVVAVPVRKDWSVAGEARKTPFDHCAFLCMLMAPGDRATPVDAIDVQL